MTEGAEKIEPIPEELTALIAADKRQREQEFLQLMNAAAQRLRCNVSAIIESHGATAVAQVVVRAE